MTNPENPPSASLERMLGYVELDPDNLSLRASVFDLALAQGRLDEADRQATVVLGRFPADLSWRHRFAILAMARQQWDDAARLLRSLVDDGADSPAIAYNLAYVDFAQGRLDDAAARLAPLVEQRHPPVPDALALLLRCMHRQGAIDEGLALFRSQGNRSPTASAWGAASLLAIDAGDLASATLWSDRALAGDGSQHEALVARGTALLARRDAAGALREFEKAIHLHPDDGRTLSGIGMAELLGMRLDASRRAFTLAVHFMPLHIGTWHGLGWCEICRQDLPAARAAFEQGLALNPNFGESHGGLAVVAALQGRAGEATESIRRALKLDPAGLSARYAQAVLDGDAADPERFERVARTALQGRVDAQGESLVDLVLKMR